MWVHLLSCVFLFSENLVNCVSGYTLLRSCWWTSCPQGCTGLYAYSQTKGSDLFDIWQFDILDKAAFTFTAKSIIPPESTYLGSRKEPPVALNVKGWILKWTFKGFVVRREKRAHFFSKYILLWKLLDSKFIPHASGLIRETHSVDY